MSIIDIYTDASYKRHKNPTGFGIGIFVIDYNDNEKEYRANESVTLAEAGPRLKCNTGRLGDDLVFYEMYAISKGLKFIAKLSDKDTLVNIYSDNLSSVDMLNGSCKINSKYKSFVKQVNNTIKSLQASHKVNINIMHIKGHCGVYGNVEADKLAKQKS